MRRNNNTLHPNHEEYQVLTSVESSQNWQIQEMFEKLDQEEDGQVYLREVVDYLAVLDNNIEQSHRVSDHIIFVHFPIFLFLRWNILS